MLQFTPPNRPLGIGPQTELTRQHLLPLTDVPTQMMVYANQVAPGRAQANPNDFNSKFQKVDPIPSPKPLVPVWPGENHAFFCNVTFNN